MNLERKGTAESTSDYVAPPRVTYVSDEAARLLVLEELADTRPGFALQVAEVRSGALIHIVHVLLLQLGSCMIHPGENRATPRNAVQSRHQTWLTGMRIS